MSFDKVKAMRNAERFLAQGKLRAAISEYNRVIEFDKKDYNTLNMLGDLYAKASEPDEAVNCFTQVAEHYGKQGFAQKAIAIYNKISRLKPDLVEVSAKLAQLYQMKGSVAEARTHYTTVAEQYIRVGKKAEALNIWKQIANLDPNNTDIYLKIADACWQDQQKEDAANAYIEAGNRLANKNQFESAITAFSRTLEIRPDDLSALKGYTKSQINLGYAEEAIKTLESSFVRQPHSRDIIYLLADCYIESKKLDEAEKIIVKLVEQEPTNYPKLLDVFHGYLKERDVVSATRVLAMVSEHMLVGGNAIELEQKINAVLELDPDLLDGIRLLVRFNNWQRDESGIKTSLERLAESAKHADSPDDEIYALTQLVMISPQNIYFAQRLHELNIANGNGYGNFENQSSNNNGKGDIPTFESFKILGDEEANLTSSENGFAEYNGNNFDGDFSNQEIQHIEDVEVVEVDSINEEVESENQNDFRELTEFEKHGLETEIEGVNFYLEQGFYDLAEKTLNEIESQFGNQPEIINLRNLVRSNTTTVESNEDSPNLEADSQTEQTALGEVVETFEENDAEVAASSQEVEPEANDSINTFENEEVGSTQEIESEGLNEDQQPAEVLSQTDSFAEEETEAKPVMAESEIENSVSESTEIEETVSEEINSSISEDSQEIETSSGGEENNFVEDISSEEIKSELPNIVEQSIPKEVELPVLSQVNPFEEMKSELSSVESETSAFQTVENDTYDDDFETSYQTGIVYREMGLIEDSIREFQDAIKLVSPQDGTRRFFLCCNMLGLCFMEKAMPNIAIMWFKQGLDSNHLSEYELNGMRYELGNAYEIGGEKLKARQYFEEIYAVDVDFRDVGIRLQNIISG